MATDVWRHEREQSDRVGTQGGVGSSGGGGRMRGVVQLAREQRGSRNGVAVEGRSGGSPGSVAVQLTWLSRWLCDAASTEMSEFWGEVGGGGSRDPSGLL